ncbi:cytoskeletal protein RodZ [Actinoplanes lutulentus]|uniref:Cellulose binding domain-containing protein n=1 Tax=Actinoplanes lutulentus TaxID=1287878 RepID=A0A327ZN65_9ACTN|nr:cellulose binding domain-containing protein [Actinoplanes lutulentus]MBB2947888.1 cytoskeletal protein RodZ [Actinoplanes lutulentus]RAK40231.1 cellulose binding domain-containing protein [Actinoplanes lutulentus]
MSKHAERRFTPARLILGLAAAVLVALVGLIVVRSGGGGSASAAGDPLLVHPSAGDLQAVENHIPLDEPLTTATAAAGASPSASSASASASPSASSSRSAGASVSPSSPAASPAASVPGAPAPTTAAPTPEKTTVPAAPKPTKTTPAPVNDLAVTYSTTATWRGGFIASVRIENEASASRDYSVTINYPSGSDVKVYGVWNTRASGGGEQVTLSGTLNAGAAITAGFQGGKDGDRNVRSPSCSVGGGTCRVS